jgi:hypothetical protein
MVIWRLALCCTALSILGACSTEKAKTTELMLVVDSDLSVPSDLDEIVTTIKGPDGKVKSATAKLGKGEPELPRSLGLVHETGPLGPLVITVEGRARKQRVITREARVSFVKGQVLVLPLHLPSSCVGVSCENAQTCTESGCASVNVDASQLDPWTGDEPGLRGGNTSSSQPDAGGSSQPDASEPADDASEPNKPTLDAGPQGVDGGQSVEDGGGLSTADAGSDAGGGVCEPAPEVCNGADDDCNEVVDDGFNLKGDPLNCGKCGQVCPDTRGVCCNGICRKMCM